MKKSHKFYAATGGLLIAGLMGYAGAYANEPVSDTNTPDQPVELATPTPSNTPGSFEVGVEKGSTDASAVEKTGEAASKATDAKQTATPAEAKSDSKETTVPEESAPLTNKSTEETNAEGAVDSSSEKDAKAEEETKGESDAQDAKDNSSESTGETEESNPAKPTTDSDASAEDKSSTSGSSETSEAADDSSTSEGVTKEDAPVVTYFVPAHNSVANESASKDVVTPDPNAQAPLLTMAKTEEESPTQEKTANGESMVVFFALPQPAGPALVPGQATPLLNAAVSEQATSSPVNANVVSTADVQGKPAVQQQSVAPIHKSAAVSAESGNLSRSLARTGSVAQYATLLSAGALILGVALLVGAMSVRRSSRKSK